jgi:hypothetical protein
MKTKNTHPLTHPLKGRKLSPETRAKMKAYQNRPEAKAKKD